VIISVKDPQIDNAGGFTTYLIMGADKMGTYEIRRRFNDFFLLREALVKQWPGCYIPPIPSKKMTVRTEVNVREIRMIDLLKSGGGSSSTSAGKFRG
jgi:hypothetical protein